MNAPIQGRTDRSGRQVAPISEAAWQRTVVDAARRLGWSVYHTFDSRRSASGFPDLVLVRDRIIYVELKSAKGRQSAAQMAWAHALSAAGAEVYLFRPDDWPEVEEVLRMRRVP